MEMIIHIHVQMNKHLLWSRLSRDLVSLLESDTGLFVGFFTFSSQMLLFL